MQSVYKHTKLSSKIMNHRKVLFYKHISNTHNQFFYMFYSKYSDEACVNRKASFFYLLPNKTPHAVKVIKNFVEK